MAKTHVNAVITTVRNSKTGQLVTVRGAGALKGRLKLKKTVDLTKPIASQAVKRTKASKPAMAAKH